MRAGVASCHVARALASLFSWRTHLHECIDASFAVWQRVTTRAALRTCITRCECFTSLCCSRILWLGTSPWCLQPYILSLSICLPSADDIRDRHLNPKPDDITHLVISRHTRSCDWACLHGAPWCTQWHSAWSTQWHFVILSLGMSASGAFVASMPCSSITYKPLSKQHPWLLLVLYKHKQLVRSRQERVWRGWGRGHGGGGGGEEESREVTFLWGARGDM